MSCLTAQISRTLNSSLDLAGEEKLWRLFHYVDSVQRLDTFSDWQNAKAAALEAYPFYRFHRGTPPLDVSHDGGFSWTPIPPTHRRGWRGQIYLEGIDRPNQPPVRFRMRPL